MSDSLDVSSLSTAMDTLLPAIIQLAQQAGEAILSYRCPSFLKDLAVSFKTDNTVLTAADLAANDIVSEGLNALTPNIPVLSEENEIPEFTIRKNWSQYWLIDPLDGTRGFVENRQAFTVNIALIHEHQSIIGILYTPSTQVCYFATAQKGAFKQTAEEEPKRIHTRTIDWNTFVAIMGHYLRSPDLPNYFAHMPGCTVRHLNSSLKLAWIAEGKADMYPRLGNTKEWDTAAAQCILQEAGGILVDLTGRPLQYNTKSSLDNPDFCAIGDLTQKEHIMHLLQIFNHSINEESL